MVRLVADVLLNCDKLPKQAALNSLTLKIEEYYGGRFEPQAVSDDGGALFEIQVEVPDPSSGLVEQLPDFPLDEVVPSWAGWRVVVLKVPPGYIDTITLGEEIDDY